MNKKIIAFILLLFVVIAGIGVLIYFSLPKPTRRHSVPTQSSDYGLQSPSLHSERKLAPVDTTAIASSTPPPPPPPMSVSQAVASDEDTKTPPIRIFTSAAQPTPTPEEIPDGDYAPAYRMVRCKLVNTVDSSDISTPIVGMVTDDLIYGGKVIIPRCSEVHGIAQIDKSRERISAEGAWTFTLFDQKNPGSGRELVVKGLALDREDDPAFTKLLVGAQQIDTLHKTWGITDGSAGLRGVVIRSNNADAIQMFVACFISGIAQSVQSYGTNAFGQAVPNPSGQGAGGVAGYIINPAAQGVENVMDHYAQTVMSSIEKDGFFIRVPAGKLFYVYVTQDLNTGEATAGGVHRRERALKTEYLEDRKLQEEVTQPRNQRDEQNAKKNQMLGLPIPPDLTHFQDPSNTTTPNPIGSTSSTQTHSTP
jgi:hypothetical protein